jgi:hypothetical protein
MTVQIGFYPTPQLSAAQAAAPPTSQAVAGR